MSTAQIYNFYGNLNRVIDGDTMVLDLDLGFRMQQEHAVRLAGLDAPERNTPEGDAATAFVKDWFEANGPHLMVFTHQNPGDKYGRYLVDVSANGEYLNADLIAAGHAKAWDGKGPRP